ncbi:ribose-phosphate pyrophosphokinase [Pontibacterium sp.]|uniref:ribose-phosphate pyrophosphokinase n=1 Tax=Pontibacterium sp. TaxID=2036026 RepID=UPI0035682E11
MKPLLFNLDSDPVLATKLGNALQAETGKLDQRRFPDGESYLRVLNRCEGRDVAIFCNLNRPDEKTLRLLFLIDTLRELGVRQIGLITPYLAYMRQDKRFQPGECVSSRPYARLLSDALDWLITVDPHLHRYNSLDEIYSIPTHVVPAAPLIAEWIKLNVSQPLLIGPDSESEQWVSQVAQLANAPFQVLQKVRHGDYDVEVTLPEVENWHSHTPVLVDDIISSGRTMQETVTHLRHAGLKQPYCIGVHGLFAHNAYEQLSDVAKVITTSCIPHPSNKIEIAEALANAAKEQLLR